MTKKGTQHQQTSPASLTPPGLPTPGPRKSAPYLARGGQVPLRPHTHSLLAPPPPHHTLPVQWRHAALSFRCVRGKKKIAPRTRPPLAGHVAASCQKATCTSSRKQTCASIEGGSRPHSARVRCTLISCIVLSWPTDLDRSLSVEDSVIRQYAADTVTKPE